MTLVVLATATLAAGPHAAAPGSPITASAALGSVTTTVVDLSNAGLPAATAYLYEALEAGAAADHAQPPAPLRVHLPEQAGPIAPALVAELGSAPGASAEMVIYLDDQADLSAAASMADWNERGAAVVDTLTQHAAKTQAALLAGLAAAGRQPRSFWIVNAVAVEGDLALAQWAAAQPEVALVAANQSHPMDTDAPGDPAAADDGPAWGLSQILAPGTWADWGVRGSGIVVANIDTGVTYTHTALLPKYRGWTPGGVDHNYNWYDPAGEPAQSAPLDQAGHGTHTMGTMVAGAAGGYTALGVAPDARWIAARACVGIFCLDTDLIAASQWMLAPTNLAGSNPRPDLRPHVINNSWGKSGEEDWYIGYVAAWNASGIFSVFSNGNTGSIFGCGSSGSPGQYAESFSVGATDGNDIIADFSSRGPTSDSRVKPEISAPGVGVPSTWSDGGVYSLSGTSMAAPHVAGTVALLWSANPALVGNLAATRLALTSSAEPRTSAECGPTPTAIPNNVYGWGRLDARQAVQAARVDVPWLSVPATTALPANGAGHVTLTLDARQVSQPGAYAARLVIMVNNSLASLPITFDVLPAPNTALVTGQLTDVWTGGAVYGRVQVGAGPNVQTDAAGQYTVTLPYGSYTLTAAATGYFSETTGLDVPAGATAGFSLMPDLPHLVIDPAPPISASLAYGERYTQTITLHNQGTQPLTVTASVPPQEWVVDANGVSGAELYDVSAALPLELSDDLIYPQPLELGFSLPIYSEIVSQIYLSSNGWISTRLSNTAAPVASCMSTAGLPRGSLAAFWADLDPSMGGAVYATPVDAETFVISFEEVPLWTTTPDPDDPTYSFQIVLHASGAVDFIYGQLGPLPARWAMGTYYSNARSQNLACYKEPTDLANRRWTLHNQPPAPGWLGVGTTNLVMAPGASANLDIGLRGFGYVPWLSPPSMGVVHLATNDPGQAAVDLPAQAIIGPLPPPSFWFPVVVLK